MAADHEITLEDVKRLRLEDGDVLAIRFSRISEDAARRLSASLKGTFPNNKILILEGDAELEVVES